MPLVKLWYGIVSEGLRKKCDRLDITPNVVRFAEAGNWVAMMDIPAKMYPAFMRRLRVMANLNLARRVDFEEGVFRYRDGESLYEIRVVKRTRSDGAEEATIELPSTTVEA